MKRLLHPFFIIGLSIILSVTDFSAIAQRNNSRGRQSHTSTQTAPSRSTQSSTARRSGHSTTVNNRKSESFAGGKDRPNKPTYNQTRPEGNRPGNAGVTKPEGNRPGNAGVTKPEGNRPGNAGVTKPEGNRPGNTGVTKPEGNRPGNSNLTPGNTRPGNSGRPEGARPGNHPGNRPGPNPPGYGNGHAPRPTPPPHAHHGWNNLHWGIPNRPLCPPPAPFYRPTPPPPHYSYFYGFPSIRSILGVTIGTAINLSINALLNSGYNITGYSGDAVYLSNVSQLSYNWPDATLYFNNGVLAASQFLYSTSYYSIDRYNNLYNRLISAYGTPYNVVPYGHSGATATWWGPNGQFITLKYAPGYSTNGSLRYFTTLSFGI